MTAGSHLVCDHTFKPTAHAREAEFQKCQILYKIRDPPGEIISGCGLRRGLSPRVTNQQDVSVHSTVSLPQSWRRDAHHTRAETRGTGSTGGEATERSDSQNLRLQLLNFYITQ